MKLIEEFIGISGEVCNGRQGRPTYFVRLAGCNLRCKWCDTKHAQEGFKYKDSPANVAKRIKESGINHVLITGGEPLLQMRSVNALLDKCFGLDSTIETNGSMDWRAVDSCYRSSGHKAVLVIDFKLPSSGMTSKMRPLFDFFLSHQYFYHKGIIKFVISTQKDLACFYNIMEKGDLKNPSAMKNFPGVIAVSPIFGKKKQEVSHQELVEAVCKYKNTVLSVQIHKILGVR